jgi:hypothetical protein
MVCSAAWSIGLSADEPAVELGREHAAIRRATPTSKLALRRDGKFKLHFANDRASHSEGYKIDG